MAGQPLDAAPDPPRRARRPRPARPSRHRRRALRLRRARDHDAAIQELLGRALDDGHARLRRRLRADDRPGLRHLGAVPAGRRPGGRDRERRLRAGDVRRPHLLHAAHLLSRPQRPRRHRSQGRLDHGQHQGRSLGPRVDGRDGRELRHQVADHHRAAARGGAAPAPAVPGRAGRRPRLPEALHGAADGAARQPLPHRRRHAGGRRGGVRDDARGARGARAGDGGGHRHLRRADPPR